MWASADLSSANFNSQGALSASDPWSPVQIVLPILTGLAVFLVCVALFLWYRSKHRNPYTHANAGNSFLSRFRRGPSPVIHERLESWVIDMEPPEHPSRLSSYSTDSSGSGIDHKPAPRSKLTSPLSFHTKIFSGKSPLPVHSLPRRQGFRIDDTDLSTKAASRSSTMVIGRTTHSHEDEEQSVLLISQNPGVDFTIESSAVQSPRTDRAEAGGDVGFEIKPPSPTQPELPGPRSHTRIPISQTLIPTLPHLNTPLLPLPPHPQATNTPTSAFPH
ncbi:hypothetical protein OE88DRAFT_1277385 [Heliocybe sulcata]|uniref:Uncharacterized protein n=1 Tax=Heliocybe sulcata TaxID=5364 RepID=A0A5C3NJF6_9AGAM|nr:hypothetical protein OE88DRAFT_1277385 [Heliocybe sulcata]